MYVNKCVKCGREFETKNPKRVICPDCLYPDKKMMINTPQEPNGEQPSTPQASASSEPSGGYNNPEGQQQFYSSYSAGEGRPQRPQQRPYNQGYNQNRPQGGYNRDNQGSGYNRGYNQNRPQGGYNRDNQGGYRRDNNQGGYNRGYSQNRPQGGYNRDNQGGFRRDNNQGGYNRGGYNQNRPQQGGFRRDNNQGGFNRGGYNNRRPQMNRNRAPKQLLVSREQLEQIELLYKPLLPLPNPDVHEVIGEKISLEPRKVFFGINLIRQKMMLPKLPFPKRKLAISPDQLFAIKNLYEPLLPLPPIGCHKIIAAQLKMDEWRVHVGIGLIRAQMGLQRWNQEREDCPEEFKKQKEAEAAVAVEAKPEAEEAPAEKPKRGRKPKKVEEAAE